ncbi:MAG: adenylosuccinate synthetase, partial [Desulfobacterota bacterium]|nr:adenylosuccinate synthetase [Thermodesulfobacteriota bacterium]
DAARLNGLNSLTVTKLDVLTGLKTLKIAVAYTLDGKRVVSMPASLKRLARCVPVYEELPGWHDDITAARNWSDLPAAARNYLKRIEEVIEVPFSIISVGPGREESIILTDPFKRSTH